MTILDTALDELRLHGIDDVFLLLTHRLTEGIRLASGEVGQLTRQEHDLLLIDRNAVSIFEILLASIQVVSDRLRTCLSGNERRDIVHWAGSIECVHGDDIANAVRM